VTSRKRVSTYCYQCVNGPDILSIDVADGIAVEVAPNFSARGLHPADGKICVKPYGLIQKLYNPHRLLKPLKRTNPRKGRGEDPGWEEIGWEEALDLMAARLRPLRDQYVDADGNPRLAFTTGGAGTPLHYMGIFPAFFQAWGGPVDRSLGSGSTVSCYHTEHIFGDLWHRAFTVLPDTPLCNYVVSFGNNVNASGGVPSARRHADARSRGMKRVQIEPHLSVTGATSSEWVPIKPKTDSAFLFAMLNVLLHEHSINELDADFLKERTAAPYLIGPNGYYLRDPTLGKPLIWDIATSAPVPFDHAGAAPALLGNFTADGVEFGVDGEKFMHHGVTVHPAHQALMSHLAPCTPEWAAGICDVPPSTIRRIANEMLAAACIGETVNIGGRAMPLRPAAVLLGKTVNNGWGAYECVWAQTVLQTLIGALETPGGLLGSASRIVGPAYDRMAACVPGEDGFMFYPFLATDKASWRSQPEFRHAHSTLTPLVGNAAVSQMLGSSSFAWLRMQGRAAESWQRPKAPDVWIVYRCNPLNSNSENERVAHTIAQFPFQVSFAYVLDETSHFADIILPECTDLESTQLLRVGGTESFEQFWEAEGWVLRQKVVEPRGETRDFDWIATELATRLGILEQLNAAVNEGAGGIALKADGYDFSLTASAAHSSEEIWDAVCRAASYTLTNGEASDGLEYFKAHGFRTRPFSKLNWYLLPRMEDQQLRFELPYQERVYRVGHQLANRLHESGIHWWDRQLAEFEPMPHFKDLNQLWDDAFERNYGVRAVDYPLWALTAKSMQFSWGSNVSIQLMREVAGNVVGQDGIQLNAQTARARGIGDGDQIEVCSPIGKITGRAILRQGVRPDVVIIVGQFGQWKTPYAKNFAMPSLSSIVPMHLDFIDGNGGSTDCTKVEVRRVSGFSQ
jgi:phenylacetyl-CoA:acceptor oxidoreductase